MIVIHFHKGKTDRTVAQSNIEKNYKFKTETKWKHNDYSLHVYYDNAKYYEKMIKEYDNSKDCYVFTSTKKNKFKFHHQKVTYNSSAGSNISAFSKYYNFPPNENDTKNKFAIVSYGGSWNFSDKKDGTNDLLYYYTTVLLSKKIPTITHKNIGNTNFGPNQDLNVENSISIENTLDLAIIGGLFNNANITVYFGDESELTDYIMYNQMIEDGINFISTSWGCSEATLSSGYCKSLDAIFQIATDKGITITAASGNDGSDDNVDGTLSVDFPSSSPNVVSCGGTSLVKAKSFPSSDETVWNSNGFASGGGVSTIFSIPDYQKNINKISTTMRCTPDISFNTNPLSGVIVYAGGKPYNFGGTSISSHFVSVILALMNLDYTGGFNKMLYKQYSINSTMFNDIIKGNNITDTGINSYYASKGYDCCTGLGSFSVKKLLSALTPKTQIQEMISTKKESSTDLAIDYFLDTGTGQPFSFINNYVTLSFSSVVSSINWIVNSNKTQFTCTVAGKYRVKYSVNFLTIQHSYCSVKCIVNSKDISNSVKGGIILNSSVDHEFLTYFSINDVLSLQGLVSANNKIKVLAYNPLKQDGLFNVSLILEQF